MLQIDRWKRILIFGIFPQLIGLVMREFFNGLSGSPSLGLTPQTIAALVVGLAVRRPTTVVGVAALPKPPAVLGERARTILAEAGHEICGLDSYLFEQCTFGTDRSDVPARRVDLRDVRASDLNGFDAVIHLAAISNDPLGNLNPPGHTLPTSHIYLNNRLQFSDPPPRNPVFAPADGRVRFIFRSGAEAKIGETRARAEGTITNVAEFGALDLKVAAKSCAAAAANDPACAIVNQASTTAASARNHTGTRSNLRSH